MTKNRIKLRSFHWKLFSAEEIATLDEFQLKALMENRSVYDVLHDLVSEYNKKHPVKFTLLSESDLLRRLHSEGFTTTRQTIKKFRDLDLLKDENGKRIWYTDDFNIVYKYEAVKRFLRTRGHGNGKHSSKEEKVPITTRSKVVEKLEKDKRASRVSNQRRS